MADETRQSTKYLRNVCPIAPKQGDSAKYQKDGGQGNKTCDGAVGAGAGVVLADWPGVAVTGHLGHRPGATCPAWCSCAQAGPELEFTGPAWSAFVHAIRHGEFGL
jgi:hypothetical protein